MSRIKIEDGLNKWQRYRLKDVDSYRKKKAEYAKTPEQREKRNAYMRLWKKNNAEKHRKWSLDYHKKNRDRRIENQRRYLLKKKFNLTPEDYERMLKEQNGGCKICNKKESGKYRFHIDHCHKTGAIRGLLCSNCNTVLGFYETRLEKIKDKLLEYLK